MRVKEMFLHTPRHCITRKKKLVQERRTLEIRIQAFSGFYTADLLKHGFHSCLQWSKWAFKYNLDPQGHTYSVTGNWISLDTWGFMHFCLFYISSLWITEKMCMEISSCPKGSSGFWMWVSFLQCVLTRRKLFSVTKCVCVSIHQSLPLSVCSVLVRKPWRVWKPLQNFLKRKHSRVRDR